MVQLFPSRPPPRVWTCGRSKEKLRARTRERTSWSDRCQESAKLARCCWDILPVFPSRRSRPRELFCPCARLHCRDRSAVHKIHKSVVLYNVPSTTRAALVAAQPGTTQVAGKEGSICLIPKPEIAGGIDRKSPASDRKRRRESLHSVSTCWIVLLSSLRTCGRQVSPDSWPHCTSRSSSS